jgi:hypothetical protein
VKVKIEKISGTVAFGRVTQWENLLFIFLLKSKMKYLVQYVH